MHQTCASGGYYISMAADRLLANYGATTGSIGVYVALTDSSGLYEKLGIETVLVRSGDNKGAGISGAPISEEQRAVYQGIVDEEYDRFVSLVASGRDMATDKVLEAADGRPFTASQALQLGLVDELTDWDKAREAFEEETKAEPFDPAEASNSSLGNFISEITGTLPKSDLDLALTLAKEVPNGVPMAWAPGLAA